MTVGGAPVVVPQRTLSLLRRLSRQVGGSVDSTVQQITASWLAGWDSVEPAWRQAITAVVDRHAATGQWPAVWQMARIEAIARAQQRTEQALSSLTVGAARTLSAAAVEVTDVTAHAEPDIIRSLRAGLDVVEVPDTAISRESVLRQARIAALHRPLTSAATAAIGGVFRRPPPPKVGGLAETMTGQVRAGFRGAAIRAATIARTETVDAYRTASTLAHTANSRVLTAWAWICACDPRSCIACWVMHGQQFPLDVVGPEGHPSCRCTRLPLLAGMELPSAEARFRRLSRRDQQAILGAGRDALFRSGRVGWSDLAVRRSNPGWRDSFAPAPVADLNLLADAL